jgi:transposase
MTAYRGDLSMGVLIGIDPHKSVNAAAAIDEQGEFAGHETFLANRKGLLALERWAKRFPERRWAVEGAAGIGRPVAQRLAMAGEKVVDVPPKLSSKARLLSTGNARKNDRLDATFTAEAALQNERLARVLPEDGDDAHIEVPRLLTQRREDLVAERTRALNRLHVLLRDLLSDPVSKQLSADAASGLLRRARPREEPARTRKQLASEVVRDVRALDRRIADLDERIRQGVEALAPPSPRSSAWDPYWPQRSSGRSATWRASRARPTSPPTPARHRWRPQAGRWYATGSR